MNTAVSGQEAGTPPVKIGPGSKLSTSREVASLLAAYNEDRFADVVAQGEALFSSAKAPSEPSKSVAQYHIGRAAIRLGWFETAEENFAAANDNLLAYSPPASVLRGWMKQAQAATPPHFQDVEINGRVAFRVYYVTEDEWVAQTIKALSLAFELNKSMLGVEASGVPVYI